MILKKILLRIEWQLAEFGNNKYLLHSQRTKAYV